jgi:hypothetical protein
MFPKSRPCSESTTITTISLRHYRLWSPESTRAIKDWAFTGPREILKARAFAQPPILTACWILHPTITVRTTSISRTAGPFNPELFEATSLLILDNEKASLEAVRYYEKQDQRPFIIGYGTGKDMIDAMDRNKLDLLAYFSPYKLGFMPVYALAKRLNNKNEPLPENLPIFPEFILPGQVDYLNFKEVYPLLIDDKLKFEAQIRPDKDKA